MSELLDSLLSSGTTEMMSVEMYILCIVSAIIMGVILSYTLQFKNRISKSFAITLAILPAVVTVVIMMVNGSVGASIAVAGTFSLVRFRSVPGTGIEITGVFIAMAIGLACGMGNLLYGVIFTIITIICLLIFQSTDFGVKEVADNEKTLRITIPEELNYNEVFNEIFEEYTENYKLTNVKTINLGSMFRLTYNVNLSDPAREKDFIDSLRIRNGNLEISCSMMPDVSSEM